MSPKPPLHAAALAHWDGGRLDLALVDAWAFYAAAPDAVDAKALLADLLHAGPQFALPSQRAGLLGLVRDPSVNPASVARAGWHAAQTDPAFDAAELPALAAIVARDDLVQALLEETPVTTLAVEHRLTALRRWLLLGGHAADFPRAVQALVRQAGHNGGAWLFDEQERACLAAASGTPLAGAYIVPRLAAATGGGFADSTTVAVADQYERWPYPQWSRVTRRAPTPLAAVIRRVDPEGPDTIPANPSILVAGCGTGREIALLAARHPESRITAIDLSSHSLGYAGDRLAQAGWHGIELIRMDLHAVAALGRRFDYISCSGVLHHLPDPEAGWAALAGVLEPGGVMHIMVYSRIARLRVQAMRRSFADLLDRSLDDDLLREARRRTMEKGAMRSLASVDFFTLAGVHDLLLHRHEDPFDVPRIGRALDALGLELLGFDLPNRARRASYRAAHPHDLHFRDRSAWAALERSNPTLFAGMYGFWCRKPIR
ncbi:MAG: class I SAM-dependent methyltransferase [Rhizomicrobium sp.]